MEYPVIMHINHCEQGQTVAEICRKAADWFAPQDPSYVRSVLRDLGAEVSP